MKYVITFVVGVAFGVVGTTMYLSNKVGDTGTRFNTSKDANGPH